MVKYWHLTERFGHRVLEMDFLGEFAVSHGMAVRHPGRELDEAEVYSRMKASHKIAVTRQVHGTEICRVDSDFDTFYPSRVTADGLMTDLPGVLLAIHTADCLPIFLASNDGRCVALLHAGWKGTARGMARIGAGLFCQEYGLSPRQVVCAIGPGIEAACYQISSEVAGQFPKECLAADGLGQWRLDLRKANRDQLISAGIDPCNIYVSDLCTRCRDDLFHSYRREKQLQGVMISFMEASHG
jgi:hypothetical protein